VLYFDTVMQKRECIEHSMQFSEKLGELHPLIIVVVQLVKTKCLPILYYAIEMCPTNKSDVLSLQYVNRPTLLQKNIQCEIKGCFARMWHWVLSVPSHWCYWHKKKENLSWNTTSQITCYANLKLTLVFCFENVIRVLTFKFWLPFVIRFWFFLLNSIL